MTNYNPLCPGDVFFSLTENWIAMEKMKSRSCLEDQLWGVPAPDPKTGTELAAGGGPARITIDR